MKTSIRRLALALTFIAALSGGAVHAELAARPADASLTDFKCVVSVEHAHGSHHYDGTINVMGRVDCEQEMSSIYIRVYLHKQGGDEWAGTPKSMNNVMWMEANAATSCDAGPGQYWGEARVTANPPAGWTPTSASGNGNGFVLDVACGLPLVEGAESPDGSEIVGVMEFERTR